MTAHSAHLGWCSFRGGRGKSGKLPAPACLSAARQPRRKLARFFLETQRTLTMCTQSSTESALRPSPFVLRVDCARGDMWTLAIDRRARETSTAHDPAKSNVSQDLRCAWRWFHFFLSICGGCAGPAAGGVPAGSSGPRSLSRALGDRGYSKTKERRTFIQQLRDLFAWPLARFPNAEKLGYRRIDIRTAG